MKKKLPFVIGITFIFYIFTFFGLQLLAKDKNFSELENRNLSAKPSFTMASLLDGTYGKAFETYIADQFPLRNQFISTKAYSELILQKKDNNGVYIGKDDYFLQNFDAPDLDLAARNATYINELAKEFKVYVGLAPTATKVLEDKLPNYATPYDEAFYISTFYNKLSNQVTKLDFLNTLSTHKDEYIYYKTDHHWTTLGAYYAYTEFCKSADLIALTLDDFKIEDVSDAFYGTLFSKGNFSFATPDMMQLFYPKQTEALEITYEATGKTSSSLYEYSHLDTKDKYSVFLDNNHPLIKIKTSIKNGRKLLVIKDSYANSFIPFLTQHYEEIQVLDLRLMNVPVATFAKEAGISEVLLLYNVQNFSVEPKLSLLLK